MRLYWETAATGIVTAGLVTLVIAGHVPKWLGVSRLLLRRRRRRGTVAAPLAARPVPAQPGLPPPAMAPGEEDREPPVVILGPLLPSERDRYFEASPGVHVLWDPPGPRDAPHGG